MAVSMPRLGDGSAHARGQAGAETKKADRGLTILLFVRDRGIFLLWVLMLVAFSLWATPYFGTFTNFALIANNAAITGIIAAGVGFGAMAGLLDFSLPGTAAIAGIVCGLTLEATGSAIVAIVVGIAVGPVVGLINAAIVRRGISPLVVTIGSLSVMTGLSSIIAGGVPIDGLSGLHAIGTDTYLGIPAPVFVAAAVFIIGTIFVTQTRGGVRFISVGGNAEAVRRAGVNANYYTALGFVLISLCAAIGGVVIAAFTTSAAPVPNTGILFDALTAVALSGMPLSGGRGSLPRVLVGALIIQTISSALVIRNIQPYWSTAITGALLILALLGERLLSTRISAGLVQSGSAGRAPRKRVRGAR